MVAAELAAQLLCLEPHPVGGWRRRSGMAVDRADPPLATGDERRSQDRGASGEHHRASDAQPAQRRTNSRLPALLVSTIRLRPSAWTCIAWSITAIPWVSQLMSGQAILVARMAPASSAAPVCV